MLHTKEATKCTIKKHSNEEMECRNIHVINAFFVITYYLCTKQCVVTVGLLLVPAQKATALA